MANQPSRNHISPSTSQGASQILGNVSPSKPRSVMSFPKSMKTVLQLWLVLATIAGLTALGSAQTQNYPTQQGSNQRVGHNGDPINDNPLLSLLNWYYPPVNNTFVETQKSSVASQFPLGSWLSPSLFEAAGSYYIAPVTGNASADAITGVGYLPPYQYAFTVPSAQNNLLAASNGGTVQTFTWKFSAANGQLPSGTSGDYGLSVWTPVGPTLDDSGNFHYTQRYFVYLVTYGTGQSVIYTVDQEASRGGWSRLGGSSTLFHYDGVNPISVTLYNTVPRDSNGNLIGVGNTDGTKSLVYANGCQLSPNLGTIVASPVLGTNPDASDPFPTRVLTAINQPFNSNTSITTSNQYNGIVYSFPYNGNTTSGVAKPYWSFSPLLASNSVFSYVAPSSAVVPSSGWTTSTATTPFYLGASYFTTAVTSNTSLIKTVTYSPTLPDGAFGVYMWTPGLKGGLKFGSVEVTVTENGIANNYIVNLSFSNGYVQVGNRRFQTSAAFPLTVQITNYDSNTADAGRLAFANSVEFIRSTGGSINSTPVSATVNINTPSSGKVLTAVNIIAAEDGHIYCLDAKGRGDGTTDIYWVYPSLPNTNVPNYIDPNIKEGIDGMVTNGQAVTVAEMPTGFNTSSALVQEVPAGSGNYFLYIATTNGRIYCIDMSGRGDYATATRTAGTTKRVWSYPDDFPATAKTSTLGSFNSSLAYNVNAAGPTIFAAAPQGRLYALDAVGNTTTHTTTPRWTYPALTTPTLGSLTTPVIDGPTGGTKSVYFGSTRTSNGGPGVLYSLNPDTGVPNWSINGTNLSGNATTFDDFLAPPTTAFNNLLGDNKNYIYIGNANGYVYCFDDGGNAIWQTNEINATVSQPVLFTNLSVLTNSSITGTKTYQSTPSIVVPTDNGIFYGLFAGATTVNAIGTKLDWGYTADGDQILSGLAAGHQYMYGTDDHGYLYAFANTGLSGGGPGGGGPGGPITVPNDPASLAYGNAKLAFLTEAQYQALTNAITAGTIDYKVFTKSSGFLNRTAFDFGETLYLFVYDFPYNAQSATGSTTASAIPNTLSFTFETPGNAQRNAPSESFKFTANAPTGPSGSTLDGFAMLPYTLQPSGGISLAPGSGSVSFTVTQVSPATGRATTIVANPITQRIAFTLANPLGIALRSDSGNYGLSLDSLGADTASFANPASDQNGFNGTQITALGNGLIPSNLLTSSGTIAHGTEGSYTFGVYDRSLMVIVNGPDNGGISGVRVARTNMGWNGGYAAVINPLSGANSLYPGLNVLNTVEDYPVNFPNDSLDYTDIHRENIFVTKEPQGKTENPLFNSVTLESPAGLFDATGKFLNNTSARTPVPTSFETDINVPQFQAANNTMANDTVGNVLNAGYEGTMLVFVDSNNNGSLDTGPGRRESYRQFTMGTGVPIDQRIDVITPNVDLGSLSGGTGLIPSSAIGFNTVFSPWFIADLTGTTAFQEAAIYQTFRALNIGNVNLPNVRVAKAFNGSPWPFYDGANDSLSYLDGSSYLWSDLDPAFSLTGPNFSNKLPGGETYIQKSRITERSGTELLTNPIYKANPNTGHTGAQTDTFILPSELSSAILATPASPRVGITPPIGFPAGSYSATLRVINDYNNNLSLDGSEPYSDPTFVLSYNVTETRLTNSFSRNSVSNASVQQHFGTGTTNYTTATFPMADDLLSVSDLVGANVIPFVNANVQPAAMRDLFGNLVSVWSSNRPATTTGILTTSTASAYRLFLGGLMGTTPTLAAGSSPLHDLGAFKAATSSQWFSVTNPYPAGATSANTGTLNSLFGVGTGETLIGALPSDVDTVRFGNPALPLLGQISPFDETQSFSQVLMAFSGTAQKQTSAGRAQVERLFLATVTPKNNGAPTLGSPIAIVEGPGVSTGRLSIVQTASNVGSVFYAAGSATERHLEISTYNAGAVVPSLTVPLGSGFLYAADPSASYRNVDNTIPTIELAFSGKLRGRPNNEIFLARVSAPGGIPAATGTNATLSYFGQRSSEQLSSTGNKGEFRTLGVNWNPATGFDILVASGTNLPASVISGTPILDPQTGVYRVQTSLGTAVIDPNVGTVRFTTTVPGPNVRVYATYVPQILRISSGQTAGFTSPSLVFENHLVGSANFDSSFNLYDRYWYQNGNRVQLTNPNLRDARYFVSYNGGAIDSKSSSRPYYETLRFGIQLPVQIPTLNTGDVDFSQFSVTSNGPVQIDPSSGRVYFTSQDEDNIVTVKFNGTTTQFQVSYLVERPEAPIPMDQPLQESGLTAFLDPFDPPNVGNRRPPLFWMFWSSNRGGSSDIYFQTLAPLLYPIATSH